MVGSYLSSYPADICLMCYFYCETEVVTSVTIQLEDSIEDGVQGERAATETTLQLYGFISYHVTVS